MIIGTPDGKPLLIIDYLQSIGIRPSFIPAEGFMNYRAPFPKGESTIWVNLKTNNWGYKDEPKFRPLSLHHLVSEFISSDDMNEIVMDECEHISEVRELTITSNGRVHATNAHVILPEGEIPTASLIAEISKHKSTFENLWNERFKHGIRPIENFNGIQNGIMLYNPLHDTVDFYELDDGAIWFVTDAPRPPYSEDILAVCEECEAKALEQAPHLFRANGLSR